MYVCTVLFLKKFFNEFQILNHVSVIQSVLLMTPFLRKRVGVGVDFLDSEKTGAGVGVMSRL